MENSNDEMGKLELEAMKESIGDFIKEQKARTPEQVAFDNAAEIIDLVYNIQDAYTQGSDRQESLQDCLKTVMEKLEKEDLGDVRGRIDSIEHQLNRIVIILQQSVPVDDRKRVMEARVKELAEEEEEEE